MSQSAVKLLPLLTNLILIFGCAHRIVQCESQLKLFREARVMPFLTEAKPNLQQNRRSIQLSQIRAHIGKLHPPHVNAYNDPVFALKPPPAHSGVQIMRRVHNGNSNKAGQLLQQPLGYQYDIAKATRFAHSKDSAVIDIGKNQFFQPDAAQYPNNLKYNFDQYEQNFKASPQFNGNVVLKDHLNRFEAKKPPPYTPVQQYAIPAQSLQFSQSGPYHGQQDGYSVVPSKQTLLHQVKSNQGQTSYSVYEEADSKNSNSNLPAPYIVSKEAQDYLQFMSSNEYFLPKRDPNYKQIDLDKDLVHYQEQLKQRQAQFLTHQHHQQQQQQRQQLQAHESHLTDSSVSSSYNQPIQVSDLFYQQDPAPPNSAVVRGSYQTGQDVFVVKSDGNKAVKHIVSTPIASQTTARTPYNEIKHSGSTAHTPEPLRFEFTERDAVGGSSTYTNSPKSQQFYYETIASTAVPQKPLIHSSNTKSELSKPITEIADDSEDNADVNVPDTGSLFQTSLKTTASSDGDISEEPKDSEAYCEKICANVYDENDEIVCGSDGYMYTGEAQLECYSSCLKINVAIKSKGSCSAL